MSPFSPADTVRTLLCELISIPSVNPTYDAGSAGEAAIAEFVAGRCQQLGLDVRLKEVVNGRPNVVARLDAPRAKSTLLFETHLDTVALEPMDDQATVPEVREGAVYGRGACDAKGSLAAMLTALEALVFRRRELALNVVLLAAADEEFQFRGVLAFIDQGERVDAAVVGEPTELKIVVAHKGCVRFRLTTLGRAAHSSVPSEGTNAIVNMARVIDAFERLNESFASRSHPLVGSPTLSIGRISGGVGVNTVADRCTIEVDRRLIPGETAEAAISEIDRVMAALDVSSEREDPYLSTPTLETPVNNDLVTAARQACRGLGLPDVLVGVPFGSDASKLWAYGNVPSIVLGPGSIRDAHTATEHIQVQELVLATKIYEQIALTYQAVEQPA